MPNIFESFVANRKKKEEKRKKTEPEWRKKVKAAEKKAKEYIDKRKAAGLYKY